MMALWNDDHVDDPNERPYGWGLCSGCGADCEEDDYDDGRKQSTCEACRRDLQADDDANAAEVVVRR